MGVEDKMATTKASKAFLIICKEVNGADDALWREDKTVFREQTCAVAHKHLALDKTSASRFSYRYRASSTSSV